MVGGDIGRRRRHHHSSSSVEAAAAEAAAMAVVGVADAAGNVNLNLRTLNPAP